MRHWMSLILSAAVLALAVVPAWAGEAALDALRPIAVQDGGRVKPLEAYARETVKLVTGKSRLENQDPVRTLVLWAAQREATANAPLLHVDHADLRAALDLPPIGPNQEGRYVSALSLQQNPRFRTLVGEAAQAERNERSTVQSKALELHASYRRLEDILVGEVPRIVATPMPVKTAEGTIHVWLAPDQVTEGSPGAPVAVAWHQLCAAAAAGQDLSASATALQAAARGVGTTEQPSTAALAREVHYYQLNPIGSSMWFYCLGAVALLATLPVRKRWVPLAAGSLVVVAFLLHGYALLLRVQISGRPPVTNMFESIVWCSWSAMLFAFVLEGFHRIRLYTAGGALAAWLGLAFAGGGLMPLDEGISPLVPVLRSNFWLTVHVPTIVASYGAFALAWVLGHVGMGLAAFAPGRRDAFHQLSRYIYRALQVGVLLLATGTILGGVWAADSWGRFWGWDPKEVGALLALLIYLAALHGRFATWWHDFGLAASAVMGFYGVLMAWVGVNMLGVGLHSYGFSKGGPLVWVLGGLFAADIGFCTWAFIARAQAKAEGRVLGDGAAAAADAEAAPLAAKSDPVAVGAAGEPR